MKFAPEKLDALAPNEVLVFASNKVGRHQKGTALYARMYLGAAFGIAEGAMGQCYAIPTKDEVYQPVPLVNLRTYINRFFDYAKEHAEKSFLVNDPAFDGVAPLFTEQVVPENVLLPRKFVEAVK